MRKFTQEILNKARAICFQCGKKYGYHTPGVCTVYKRLCDLCLIEKPCTEVRDFGGLALIVPREKTRLRNFIRQSNAIEGVVDEDSYKQAMKAWRYITRKKELSFKRVLKVHEILMENQNIAKKEKGALRKRPVYIGSIYNEAPEWFYLPTLLEVWVRRANDTVSFTQFSSIRKNNEERIKEDHIGFEGIHPFIDGNGRVGRILMNWQFKRAGMPLIVILEKKKYMYYDWFNKKDPEEELEKEVKI